ncbi:MAG: ABC transporter permease subunit, partial [Planctomycetota bacterium]
MRRFLIGYAFLLSTLWSTFPEQGFGQLPFENDGDLFVAMYNSDTYQILTKRGEPVGTMTTPGLNGPRGLAFNPANGDIWVTGEFSNTIYIFDRNRQFQWSFTDPDFNQPVGVSFKMTPGTPAEDQEVYISNSGSGAGTTGNNIMVFDQQGNFLRGFTREVFGYNELLLPVAKMTSNEFADLSPIGKALDILRHALIPAFVTATAGMAGFTRVLRAQMIEFLSSDFIRTARAKGLGER